MPTFETGKDWPFKPGSMDELNLTNPYMNKPKNLSQSERTAWNQNQRLYQLRQMHRALKPGGTVTISGTKGNPFARMPDKKILEDMGFEVIQHYRQNTPERIARQKMAQSDGGKKINKDKLYVTILRKK